MTTPIYGRHTRPLTREEMDSITPATAPIDARAAELGLPAGLRVTKSGSVKWRCGQCERMITDAEEVYVPDGVRVGDTAETVRSLHVHHIRPWAGNPALRFDDDNAVTLCRECHSWVHSNANASGEYLK